MKNFFKNIHPNYMLLFIAMAVTLSSQFYFSVFADGFRISASVILLPLLLMTVGEDLSTVKTCTATAVFIFAFRTSIHLLDGGAAADIMALYLPNSLFYIFYGVLFAIVCSNKYTVGYAKMFGVLFCCDFLSNICEICVTRSGINQSNMASTISTLAAIALTRTVIVWLFLVGEKQYRTLLQKEEHEKRYQRLFLMTTGLKSEIYFMKKNSEEIENVMGTAYRLYENLNTLDLNPEIKNMSLALAKDVHEIKKDYIRIIKGIENEINEEYDEKRMMLSDVLYILKDTTYNLLEAKKLSITLNFQAKDDFVTTHHYELMNILKNLVTNAIEAIENGEKGDTIIVEQAVLDEEFFLVVKDNGPGISKRHLPNIFKMGYSTKFDAATGNIYRGVGLCGVKSTIEELGGTITAQSVYGDGTQFTIKLPLNSIKAEKNNKTH